MMSQTAHVFLTFMARNHADLHRPFLRDRTLSLCFVCVRLCVSRGQREKARSLLIANFIGIWGVASIQTETRQPISLLPLRVEPQQILDAMSR